MRVLPSEIVAVIDGLFGPRNSDIDEKRIGPQFEGNVGTLLSLLDQVPPELISFGIINLTELMRCRASLTIAMARWGRGGQWPAEPVNMKDPVQRIKRLMQLCQDELPPSKPELPFIDSELQRAGIERLMQTAWRNFGIQDWLGSATFAASALEAVLLWGLESKVPGKPYNNLHLADLVDEALNNNLIPKDAADIAHQANDARNLIHPGRGARLGSVCTKGSALTALTALHRVIEHFAVRSSSS